MNRSLPKPDLSVSPVGNIRTTNNSATPVRRSFLHRAARTVADHNWLFLLPPVAGVLLMGRIPLQIIAATIVLIPIPWLCHRIHYGYFSVSTPLDFPILFFLLMNLQGLYPSTNLRLTLPVLIQNFVQVALFYGLVNGLTNRRRIGLVVLGLLFSSLVIAIGGLGNTRWPATKLFALPMVYSSISDIHIPLLSKLAFHPNFVGAALAMLSPLAVVLLWSQVEIQWRVLSGISLLIVLPVLVLTQSRGAFIGLAIALVFVAAYRNHLVRWALPLAVLVIALVVYRVGLAQVAEIVLITDTTSSVRDRFEIWTRALYIIQDFPYTGIGPGTYGIVTPILYPFFLLGPDAIVAHPHNIYLGAAVDFGIPGFITFIALTTTCLLVTLTGLRRSKRSAFIENLFLGLFAGFIVYLVHGMFDQTTFSTKNGVALWAMMGLSTGVWLRLPAWNFENTWSDGRK